MLGRPVGRIQLRGLARRRYLALFRRSDNTIVDQRLMTGGW